MRKKGWIVLSTCCVLLAFPVRSGKAQILGGGVVVCTNCADEVTTIAMKAQQVLQYLKEVQIALNALQIVQMMIREGQNQATHPSTNIAADLGTLSTILVQSQGLAGDMAQMDAIFRNVYAPYSISPVVSFAAAYNQWATTTLNTIHGTANVAGMQGSMLMNEQAFLAQVQAMNQTDMGQDQLIQLGNAIGTEEIAQLQKLRQLMIADMSSKSAFLAQQVNTQQAQQAAQQSDSCMRTGSEMESHGEPYASKAICSGGTLPVAGSVLRAIPTDGSPAGSSDPAATPRSGCD